MIRRYNITTTVRYNSIREDSLASSKQASKQAKLDYNVKCHTSPLSQPVKTSQLGQGEGWESEFLG